MARMFEPMDIHTPRENDPEKDRGLFEKFRVERADSADAQERHASCDYFVLDLTHDALAWIALAAYEEAARMTGYIALAEDLRLKAAVHAANAIAGKRG